MNKNLKFVLGILAVFGISFILGHVLWDSVDIRDLRNRPMHPVVRTVRTAPAHPIQTAPQTPQTPAKPQIVSLDAGELAKLIQNEPERITSIEFVSGTNKVNVNVVGQRPVSVLLIDEGNKTEVRNLATAKGIGVLAVEKKSNPVMDFLGSGWILIIAAGALGWFFITMQRRNNEQAMRSVSNQLDRARGMGDSRARSAADVAAQIEKVSFDDVAGCDEAVKELRRVVKGIAGAETYARFGAKMPQGILLIGPPGTGKTLLAKAVAHEMDGSMEITSGSEFVEMLVGVGAKRVRDMFAKARGKVAETGKPCVIFIDEIDAIGGKRGGGPAGLGSNSEREQTLNQLLVEMDGVIGNQGIIIIAATNRADMLDDALLRPGRFDCQIQVDLPDRVGREAIFAIHMRKKAPMATDVTIPALAQRTYTYSGAEIKAACDRAALIAAEKFEERVRELTTPETTPEQILAQVPVEIAMVDFDEALDFVRYGDAKPTKQKNLTLRDKENTSVHEAGHAVVSAVFEESDPVMKITIMRRSKAAGYVAFMPDNDRSSFSREQALARIVVAMAGRASQEVYLDGTCDSGASNDFQQATNIARQMVMAWGMSKLGHISVSQSTSPFMGSSSGSADAGPKLANEIDDEVRHIVDSCYAAAVEIVKAEEKRIGEVVRRLLDKETVLSDEWNAMLEEIPSNISVEQLKLPYWKGVKA